MTQNNTSYFKKIFSKIKEHLSLRKVVGIILKIVAFMLEMIAFIFKSLQVTALVIGYWGVFSLGKLFLSKDVKLSLITLPFTNSPSLIITGDIEMLIICIAIFIITIISFLSYLPSKVLEHFFKSFADDVKSLASDLIG